MLQRLEHLFFFKKSYIVDKSSTYQYISALHLIFLFFLYKKMSCERHLSRSSGLECNESTIFSYQDLRLSDERAGFRDHGPVACGTGVC